MEVIEKKNITDLNADSVSILTRKFIEFEGKLTQVGENHRRAYVNSPEGRQLLQENEPENIAQAVLTMWGDTPIVVN